MFRETTAGFGAFVALAIAIGVLAASSTAAGPAVPTNQSPPTIRGTAREGSALQGDPGHWDSRSAVSYSYQWRRCLPDGIDCIDVPNATDQIYTARGTDVARTLRFVVTARNKDGATTAVSAPAPLTAALAAQAPHNTVLPAISGSPAPGQILTATPGTWTGAIPIAFSYRWRRCDPSGGACIDTSVRTQTYKLSSGDANHALRVLVTATNAAGSSASLSDPSSTVTRPSKPANTSPPTISGTTREGKTLTASRGTWVDGPSGYSYGWERCNKKGNHCGGIGGAERTTYTLTSAEVGHSLRFKVTAKSAGGSTTVFSAPTAAVAIAPAPKLSPPTNISPPTISGMPRQGQVLTGDRGNWTGAPTDYEYTWMRCNESGSNCSGISDAHNTTYTLTSDDVGHTIRIQVEARNADGSTKASSAATSVVAPAPPQNTTSPTISGEPRQGMKLSGNRGNWSGEVTDFDDSWLRCNKDGGNCSTIKGAAGRNYVLSAADVGKTIRFRVEAKNASGSNTATSAPTAIIASSVKAPVNKSAPTISGVAAVGQVLTMSTGKWNNSPASYQYQWLRCDQNGGGCIAIAGAFGQTWRVLPASVGHTIRGRVTASNSGGSAQAASAPTRIVGGTPAPPPRPATGCPPRPSIRQVANVATITPPARLLVDTLRSDPRVVTRGTGTLVVRFHVTSTCGGPVQGALVYATATPYNQFAIPPEATTGPDGWATLVFRRLRGFPVSSRQQLIALFVRARKPGESLLAGISTRRLVSIPVRVG
jgi:large repetitive protein